MPEVIRSQNLDANETAFFAQELTHLKAKTYDIKYPQYKATKHIPVDTSAGPAAEYIEYHQWDSIGIMKIIANYATDLPRSDVFGKPFITKVESIGGSYGFTIQEIRAAQKNNRPLKDMKAKAARKSYDQKINEIGWFGEPKWNLNGMLTQPNVPAGAVAVGPTSGNSKWEDKTPQEIYDDIVDNIDAIREISKGVHEATTVLLPIEQYNIISKKNLGNGNDTTILNYVMRNRPGIEFDYINELKDVASLPSGDAGPKDVMIVYAKDPENLTYELPQLFEQFPAQERGLEMLIPTHGRVGGVVVRYPLSMKIVEGI